MQLSSPWWQAPPQDLEDVVVSAKAQLHNSLGALIDPKGNPTPRDRVPRFAVGDLDELFSADRHERWQQLTAIEQIHAAETLSGERRVAIPPRLWDRLLQHLGEELTPGERQWTAGLEAEGLPPQGIKRQRWTEWWAWPGVPGAGYGDRLWAWGLVAEPAFRSPGLGGMSPRLVWQPGDGGWRVHPAILERFASRPGPHPLLERGPGFLMACVVDAILELCRGNSLTDRDHVVMWGTLLLPVTASSLVVRGQAKLGAGVSAFDTPPAYARAWPFFLLHPRTQSALIALDHLCTLLLSEAWPDLESLLSALGRAPTDTSPAGLRAAIDRLIHDIATSLLGTRAAKHWDSGFGFRLIRRLMRDTVTKTDGSFVDQWEQAVYAGADDDSGLGPLALRLQEAFTTGLSAKGRPAYPGGPVASQILDLTWLRWTDPEFLGD